MLNKSSDVMSDDEFGGNKDEMLRYVLFKFGEKFDALKEEILLELNKKDERIYVLETRVATLNRDLQLMKEKFDEVESTSRQ